MPSDTHLPEHTLRAYRNGRLAPAEALVASDHLLDCPACRDALAQTDGDPAYEELAAAADGTLDLADRLDDVPAAAAELADLRAFKREMATQAGRVYRPTSGRPSEASRIIKLAPTRRVVGRRFLAAAAVVAFCVGGWWTFRVADPSVRGAELLVDRSGNRVDLASLPADLRAAVERTLGTGHPEMPAAGDPSLHPPRTTLAGPGGSPDAAFRVLTPVATRAREPQPTLRWAACSGAAAYFVTLAKLDGTGDLSSPRLPGTQTSWTVSEPLASGAIYRWQVEAVDADGETLAKTSIPPAPDARFQVLAGPQRDELARVEAKFGQFPLVMATAYGRVGLTEEAADQWALLAREHPGSALARRWAQEGQADQSPAPINTKGAQ